MRHALLIAALLVAGSACKKDPAPLEVAVVPAPKPPAPDVAVPLTDSTLSLFEPANGRCEWLRLDPVAKKRAVVASFDGDCRGARVSWSLDQAKALVWFDPSFVQRPGYFSSSATPGYAEEKPVEGAKPRLYEVAISAMTASSLPFPAGRGELIEVAFGPKGEALAFFEERLTEAQAAAGEVEVDGTKVKLESEGEGLPGLAHSFRLTAGGAWTRAETVATTQGADYSPGWRATEASRTLGPRSVDLLAAHLQGDGVLDPALLGRLALLAPKGVGEGDGAWVFDGTTAGSFYVWEISAEGSYTTGRVVFGEGERLFPAPGLGFTDGDLVALRTSGSFLLVSAQDVGTHPRLYDLNHRELVFASDSARAAVFWKARARAEHRD
ncbi:MAG: hypothetical protein ACYC8T_25345 [Myxococcaceae bacterium]